MRITIINWNRRRVGGAETYLSTVVLELVHFGHEVSFWHEIDLPAEREQIKLPVGMRIWNIAELGTERALKQLREWQPDIIYAHGLLDPMLEAQAIKIAPTVFYAHNYYGNCISGSKVFKFPIIMPCHRAFGWQCLIQYYPRHCGGLNPITMLREYRLQSKRLENLRECKAIVTNSNHIKSEYLKKGFDSHRVYVVPPYVKKPGGDSKPSDESRPSGGATLLGQEDNLHLDISFEERPLSQLRLLFLGRMDTLKGGATFLEALPLVRASLDQELQVKFVGDGPERKEWEHKAAQIIARCPRLSIEFTGWVDGCNLDMLWPNCDLLVIPSLLPESFGIVGLEGGWRGVPVAAFASGGITDWLVDGINGYLASSDPPTSENLAKAIINCLRDPVVYARLRHGAIEVAERFSMERHLAALLEIFKKASGNA